MQHQDRNLLTFRYQFAAASALSLVSALPQQSHRGSEPAWFNPYEKFPAPTEHPPANTTSQGAFYDKAWAAAAKFKALSTYGESLNI